MARAVVLLFFIMQGFLCSAEASENPLLLHIAHEEEPRETRVVLGLSDMAGHRLVASGQRIDLFLKGTTASVLDRLPDTGRFIRTLIGQKEHELMVSFLMRSLPEDVRVLEQKSPAALILEMDWGKPKSVARPAIMVGNSRSPSEQSGLRPSAKSLYGDGWKDFYSRYDTPFQVKVPLSFTLADLPRIIPASSNSQSLDPGLKAALEAIAENDWDGALKVLQRMTGDDLDPLNYGPYLVVFGEALVRAGKDEEASLVLSQFFDRDQNSALQGRARYLLAFALAAAEKPYEAGWEISKLINAGGSGRYGTYAQLLLAEIRLSCGQPDKALEVLRVPPPLKGGATFLNVWNRRLADALVATGEHARALILYGKRPAASSSWTQYLLSLAGYAEALYRAGEYARSLRYYDLLAEALDNQPAQAMAKFGGAMAQSRSGETNAALARLNEIGSFFPESEAAFLVWLKTLDLQMQAKGGEVGINMAAEYAKIATAASSRSLREEAAFKEALALALGGDRKGSMQRLQQFLRDFSRGMLRAEAEAFLVDTLPEVVEEYLKEGHDMQAIVLVEQNRSSLASCSLSTDFLLGLGKSFFRLGLIDRAEKVFSFMVDSWAGRPEEAILYPFLCRALFAQGKYEKAAEYAGRYLERFAGGEAEQELFNLRVEALWNCGLRQEAERVLDAGAVKGNPETAILATRVYWDLAEFEKVGGVSGVPKQGPEGNRATQALAYRAEALFRAGKKNEALPIYQDLRSAAMTADLALYRCAQIKLGAGEKEEALNLFRRLAEEGRKPYWRKMAGFYLAAE